MKPFQVKLPGKQTKALIALLGHSTLAEAAQEAEISETTLWRWLQEPNFKNAYHQARREVVQQAISHLQKITGEAVEVLRLIMIDTEKPASTRVQAARTILENSIKSFELEEFEQRLDLLERRIEERSNR